ncbi:dTDP-4-dehydrorhamnose reductase [Thermaurantiacus sp.]
MRVLLTGASGQLGRALAATRPAETTLIACTRADLDIGEAGAVARVVAEVRPDALINAAAYTAVDRAESNLEEAMRVNGHAPGWLAAAASRLGAAFVQVSTDFVFDGSAPVPYPPDARPAPLGAYGRTKLAGEEAVRAAHPSPLIVRTAWVYAAEGQNFLQTMLRLMAERGEVRVVADQVGTPTHAASLARALWGFLGAGATGVFHWTDAGVASWYDFAVAIAEEAHARGLLPREVAVRPIRTIDYPTPARRPAWSVLDKTAAFALLGPARHWRAELRSALDQLATGRSA